MEENVVVVDQIKEVVTSYDKIYRLKTICDSIDFKISAVKSEYFAIGCYLSQIVAEDLLPDDFKNIYDFAEARFGFGRTWTKNVIAVYQKFGNLERLNAWEYSDDFKDVPFSNLVELIPISEDEELCKLLAKRPVKAIKNAKKLLENIDSNEKANLVKIQNVTHKLLTDEIVKQAPFLCVTSTFWDENNKCRFSINFDHGRPLKYKVSLTVGYGCSLGCNYLYCGDFLDHPDNLTEFVRYILSDFFTRSEIPNGFEVIEKKGIYQLVKSEIEPKKGSSETLKTADNFVASEESEVIDVASDSEEEEKIELGWDRLQTLFTLHFYFLFPYDIHIAKVICQVDGSVIYFPCDERHTITSVIPLSLDQVISIMSSSGIDEETIKRLTEEKEGM